MAKQVITLEVRQTGAAAAAGALKGIAAAAAGIALAMVGVRKAWSILKVGIKDALLLEKSIQQLRATFGAMGSDVGKSMKSVLKFANIIENTTTKSADQALELSNLALQYGRSEEHMQDMVRATIALESAVGLKANMALRGLSQTLHGQSGVLKRYVPQLEGMTEEQMRSGEAIRMIAEQFMPALTGEMKTVHGQYQRVSNLIASRYVEELGNAIINNKAFVQGLKTFGNVLVELAPKFDDLRKTMVGFGITGVEVLKGIIEFGGGAVNIALELARVWNLALIGNARWRKAFAVFPEEAQEWADRIEDITESNEELAKTQEKVIELTGKWSRGFGRVAAAMRQVKKEDLDISKQIKAADIAKKRAEQMKKLAEAAKKAAEEARKLDQALAGIGEEAMAEAESQNRDMLVARFEREKEFVAKRQGLLLEQDAFRADMAKKQTDRDNAAMDNWIQRESDMLAERQRRHQEVAGFIGDTMGTMFADMITGQKTFGEAAVDTLHSVAMTVFKTAISTVINNAVVAATGAAKATSAIPIIGPIIAAAASGAVLAATMAMKNKLKPPSMAFGGIVTGGAIGQDSVPITAMPGERLLNRRETREFEDFKAGRQQRGGQTTINVTPPAHVGNKMETQRYFRDTFIPALREEARRGGLRDILAGAT